MLQRRQRSFRERKTGILRKGKSERWVVVGGRVRARERECVTDHWAGAAVCEREEVGFFGREQERAGESARARERVCVRTTWAGAAVAVAVPEFKGSPVLMVRPRVVTIFSP